MRSKIEANEYKDYILGFIFYKFLSDKEVEYLKKNDWEDADLSELVEEDTDIVEQCKKNIGYFISYENLFSTWLKKGKDFDVSNITDALSAFDRLIDSTHRKVFDKIFDTLQTGLSKLGETSGARTKAISDLLGLIKDIPMDERQGYDVLGFIYEYLISNFAANAGKKAGEFYTPHEVSLLMSEIVANHLKSKENIAIYDPTSGSGSLLINIGRSAAKYMDSEQVQYYAQELKENTYNLTRMNLVMRGITPASLQEMRTPLKMTGRLIWTAIRLYCVLTPLFQIRHTLSRGIPKERTPILDIVNTVLHQRARQTMRFYCMICIISNPMEL